MKAEEPVQNACKSKEDAQEVSVPDDYEFDEDLVDEDVEELPSDYPPLALSSRASRSAWPVAPIER